MHLGKLLVTVCLVFASAPAGAAGTIYKCKDANGGTTFSPAPCGKDAKEVQADTSSSLKNSTGTGNDAIAGISASVADINCRDSAYATTVGAADSDIHLMLRQKDEMQRSIDSLRGTAYQHGSDEVTAEVRSSSYTQQIVAIDQRVEQKRETAQAAYRQAISACDAKRDQRGPATQP